VTDPAAPAPDPHPRWRRQPGATWRQTLRGVVVLAPGAEEPVTIAGSGGAVWELLDRPRTTEDLVSELSQRYSTDPETVRRDLDGLLAQLAGAGALEEVPPLGS
jgi:hypothetical protein